MLTIRLGTNYPTGLDVRFAGSEERRQFLTRRLEEVEARLERAKRRVGFLRELEDLRLWPSVTVNETWINISYPKERYTTTMRVYSLVGWSGC